MDLQQYRPAVVVQAARIEAVPAIDTVQVRDVHGTLFTIHQPDLFDNSSELPFDCPVVGDWLVRPDAYTPWKIIGAVAFEAEWNPVSGPVLF